ncbi:putative metal ion transporter [Corchorus olitorius]|uniref:Metal ion transporter n=1 Tax=Corchorus olitorius TaxID=93759 RepID=A0A1R3JK47_9ROSI|nr:putative metal ion transporter [Corchorus olitorius]
MDLAKKEREAGELQSCFPSSFLATSAGGYVVSEIQGWKYLKGKRFRVCSFRVQSDFGIGEIYGQELWGRDESCNYCIVSVCSVALFTLAMAAAIFSSLSSVKLGPQWAGICNGMAAGVILAAS